MQIKDAKVIGLTCPSDGASPGFGGGGNTRSGGHGFQGNYVLCAGNTLMTRNSTTLNGMFHRDSTHKFSSITDGTSHTVMGSESILRGSNVTGPDGEGWGEAGGYWGGGPHGSYGFTTLEAPNTALADQVYSCKNLNFPKAPCTDVTNGSDLRNFARSYHTGGVMILMADASVQFVSNNVNLVTWRAMGSRAGGEAVSQP